MIKLMDGTLDDKNYVLCGWAALIMNGLSIGSGFVPYVFVENKDIAGCYGRAIFVYSHGKINYTDYLKPDDTTPTILVPNKQRALVDYIRCIDELDEGTLIEGLKTYLEWDKESVEALEEVADVLGLSRDVLHYWVKEALEDEEV